MADPFLIGRQFLSDLGFCPFLFHRETSIWESCSKVKEENLLSTLVVQSGTKCFMIGARCSSGISVKNS